MVEGETQVDHGTDGDGIVDDHRALLDGADAQDGAVGLVDDGGGKERAAGAVVGDGEGAAAHVVGLEAAGTSALGQVVDGAGDAQQRQAVGALNDRHEQAFVAQRDRQADVDGLVQHQAINIGLAVSLGDEGLIVPVIKGADGLSLLGIARAVNDLAERARARRLQPDDVRGSTLTITNHGTSRSLFATPIINQPNCAILGVGAIQKRPVVIDDAIAIRPMVYLGLTFDHRILDGFSADAFLGKVVDTLENWI